MHALTTAELFRATWSDHTAKRVARASNSPVGTAKAWVTGRFKCSADTLLRMAQGMEAENIELRRELIRRLEGYGYADTNMASSTGVDAAALRGVGGEVGGSAGSSEVDQAHAVRVAE